MSFSYVSESSEGTIEASNFYESFSEEEFVTLDGLLDNDVESLPGKNFLTILLFSYINLFSIFKLNNFKYASNALQIKY